MFSKYCYEDVTTLQIVEMTISNNLSAYFATRELFPFFYHKLIHLPVLGANWDTAYSQTHLDFITLIKILFQSYLTFSIYQLMTLNGYQNFHCLYPYGCNIFFMKSTYPGALPSKFCYFADGLISPENLFIKLQAIILNSFCFFKSQA